jgi:hypothetical protein
METFLVRRSRGDPENRELPCFFPCYQGNAHAETGSHADACATTLGMRSQIFWFPDNFIARTTELSVPVAFVLDYGSSLC